MRGNKRRAAVFVTAANKPQPALSDAILDVVNRKGMRCCVECGATSTPQWREGPMGPKTLCNACGVRRQRLLRKQQAATVGSVPTAPVAAVQARRRMAARSALEAPMAESDELPYGAVSGSEHSSDETEVHWATTTTPIKHHPRQPLPLLQRQQLQLQTEMEESCNEDENAAYDLLFFAGVECGAGGLSGICGGPMVGVFDEQEPGWRFDQLQQLQQNHGHNTRRQVQPVRHRLEDFYYYDEEAAGLGSGGGEGGCKRRKIGAAPLHQQSRPRIQVPPWHAGSSYSSTEDQDVAESELASQPVQRAKLSDNRMMQQQQLLCSIAPPAKELRQLPTLHWPAGGNTPAPQTFVAAAGNVPALSAAVAASTATFGTSAAASTYSPSPLLTHLPVALPVLPLSLSLPSLPAVSAKDYETLLALQLDFQRACLQLHQANVQCEAVGAVVAEHREAAGTAHQQAAAASQQLATEARAVAERYRLRDVLSELHSATTADGTAAQGLAATATCRIANVSED